MRTVSAAACGVLISACLAQVGHAAEKRKPRAAAPAQAKLQPNQQLDGTANGGQWRQQLACAKLRRARRFSLPRLLRGQLHGNSIQVQRPSFEPYGGRFCRISRAVRGPGGRHRK